MKRKKSETRFIKCVANGDGRWQIVYKINSQTKKEYRRSEEAARARSIELKAMLEGKPVPTTGNTGPKTGGASRIDWINALWEQVEALRSVPDPDLRVQALNAIAAAFKIIREDLEILEHGTGKPSDPSAMSTEELEQKLVLLKDVKAAANG